MTADLVTFFNARLDEDERRANSAGTQRIKDAVYVSPTCYSDDILFLHRYDAARALAEVAAKRAILELHHVEEHWAVWSDMPDDASGSEREGCMVCTLAPSCPHPPAEEDVVYPCRTLRLLASVYADHPDYDPSWKPDTD